MCGIAGIVKFKNDTEMPREKIDAALTAMSAAIAHRGPDGSGIYRDPRPQKLAALVHRRLAIIDLPGGTQPMPNEDGTVHVVFNGEIYNHADLRRELQSAGHKFKTDHSDTEVLVHGWEQWGIDLPQKLLGMFAFAIWDTCPSSDGTPRDTLFLARDRMGQKPLFYAPLEDGIAFGSTIPSVLAWPEVPRRVPREQIAVYLQFGYIPPPLTIFRDVVQVWPGGWMRLRGEVMDGGRYWPITDDAATREHGGTAIMTDDEATAALRKQLARAVESQLVADVPIACFLSGGIDSSILAALMQQAARKSGAEPIRTVSVGFSESGFDETAFAAQVAAHIGSTHTRLEVRGDQDVLGTLQVLMQTSLGQPFADSSLLPTYHLSKAVRNLAPVAIAGDGGDELFAGYDRYRAMMLLQRWSGAVRLMPRHALLGSLVKKERYRRLTAAAREKELSERYSRLAEICPEELVEEMTGEWPMFLTKSEEASPLQFAMSVDQVNYLPGDLLYKVDSASMADALEVRAPFLDHHIVEFANALPDNQLLRAGTSKYILRRAFADALPPAILARGKKGFAVPIGNWFRTTLRPALDMFTASDSFCTTHLRVRPIRDLIDEHLAGTRDHTHRLFALLMLELFWREFLPALE